MTSALENRPSEQPNEPEPTRADLVPAQSSTVRAWLERQPGLPSPVLVGQSAKWWVTEGTSKLGALFLRAPLLVLREIKPICVGLGRIAHAWARWCAVADYAEAAAVAEGSDKAKHLERVEIRRSGRRKLSFGVAVVLLGTGTWAYFVYPEYLALCGVVLVVVADMIGRRGQEKKKSLPPPARIILKEGVPLSQLTAAIVECLEREGREIGIARPMRYDHARREYRLRITCLDEITSDHLRAIERAVGAADHTVRALATDTATVRELVLRNGDPLAEVPPAPWIETGSVSISEPLDLGVSVTETPFALTFAGQHIKVVGNTGSGKSSWFLRNCIDRLSACRNVAILGVDLSNGPEFALWRGVIQKKAVTPEQVESLLQEACDEIDWRSALLTHYAEDDDPENDHLTEWCDELADKVAPAWVILCDEYALMSQLSAAGQANAQKIVRTGRKVWVSLVMLAQKTGNTDFQSTVMTTQCNTTIGLPMSPKDAVELFGKAKRDAGWDPSILTPGTKDERNDAGKCFVESPLHRTPDIYSCYAPLSAAEVKARARRRLAEGICPMYYPGRAETVAEEAAVVPPLLAAAEEVFAEAGNPDWMPTSELLPRIAELIDQPDLTANRLAAELGVEKVRRRPAPKSNPVSGYTFKSIQEAMGQL